MARAEQAVLLTEDKGISELIVSGSAGVPSGLVILRIDGLSGGEKSRIVAEVFKRYASRLSENVIMTVMPGPIVRIRQI